MYGIIRTSYRFLYPNPDSSYVTSVSFKYHELICCKSMILTANFSSKLSHPRVSYAFILHCKQAKMSHFLRKDYKLITIPSFPRSKLTFRFPWIYIQRHTTVEAHSRHTQTMDGVLRRIRHSVMSRNDNTKISKSSKNCIFLIMRYLKNIILLLANRRVP